MVNPVAKTILPAKSELEPQQGPFVFRTQSLTLPGPTPNEATIADTEVMTDSPEEKQLKAFRRDMRAQQRHWQEARRTAPGKWSVYHMQLLYIEKQPGKKGTLAEGASLSAQNVSFSQAVNKLQSWENTDISEKIYPAENAAALGDSYFRKYVENRQMIIDLGGQPHLIVDVLRNPSIGTFAHEQMLELRRKRDAGEIVVPDVDAPAIKAPAPIKPAPPPRKPLELGRKLAALGQRARKTVYVCVIKATPWLLGTGAVGGVGYDTYQNTAGNDALITQALQKAADEHMPQGSSIFVKLHGVFGSNEEALTVDSRQDSKEYTDYATGQKLVATQIAATLWGDLQQDQFKDGAPVTGTLETSGIVKTFVEPAPSAPATPTATKSAAPAP